MPASIEVVDGIGTLEYRGDQKTLADAIMVILQNHVAETIKTRTYPAGPGGVKTLMSFGYVENGEGHGLDHASDTDTLAEIQMRLRAAVSEAVIAFTEIDGTSLEVGETLGDDEVGAFSVFVTGHVGETMNDRVDTIEPLKIHDDNKSFSITVFGNGFSITELFKFELGTRIGEPT